MSSSPVRQPHIPAVQSRQNTVSLRPCPSWCTLDQHFTEDRPVDTDAEGDHSTDMCVEITPGQARAVSAALLESADSAEHITAAHLGDARLLSDLISSIHDGKASGGKAASAE